MDVVDAVQTDPGTGKLDTDTIRLLVVDDSKMIRDAVTRMFSRDDRIQVVGQAADGNQVISAVKSCNPDVITLDVSMPGMDGITALKHIMIEAPTPTVILSSLTLEGAGITFDALRYGAVDFIAKPSALDGSLEQQVEEIRNKIRYASQVEVGAIKYIRPPLQPVVVGDAAGGPGCQRIVVLGAAEGGYGALLKIIPRLKGDTDTAYLVSLYSDPKYVEAFADYVNAFSRVRVKRADHDEMLQAGVCYLSSGSNYMSAHKVAAGYQLHLNPVPFSNRKGSVDMLLFSAAESCGDHTTGVVLSGTGSDGAEGLEEVLRLGGTALVQDPKTCLCKEMPNAALSRAPGAAAVADVAVAAVLDA